MSMTQKGKPALTRIILIASTAMLAACTTQVAPPASIAEPVPQAAAPQPAPIPAKNAELAAFFVEAGNNLFQVELLTDRRVSHHVGHSEVSLVDGILLGARWRPANTMPTTTHSARK